MVLFPQKHFGQRVALWSPAPLFSPSWLVSRAWRAFLQGLNFLSAQRASEVEWSIPCPRSLQHNAATIQAPGLACEPIRRKLRHFPSLRPSDRCSGRQVKGRYVWLTCPGVVQVRHLSGERHVRQCGQTCVASSSTCLPQELPGVDGGSSKDLEKVLADSYVCTVATIVLVLCSLLSMVKIGLVLRRSSA